MPNVTLEQDSLTLEVFSMSNLIRSSRTHGCLGLGCLGLRCLGLGCFGDPDTNKMMEHYWLCFVSPFFFLLFFLLFLVLISEKFKSARRLEEGIKAIWRLEYRVSDIFQSDCEALQIRIARSHVIIPANLAYIYWPNLSVTK